MKVPLSLYRQTIRILGRLTTSNEQAVALRRWAEFLPVAGEGAGSSFLVQSGESPVDIARRCFEAPLSSTSLQNSFEFIKEASSSLSAVEVLGAWEGLREQGQLDLRRCLCLLSASLRSAECGDSLQGSIAYYEGFLDRLLHRLATAAAFLPEQPPTRKHKMNTAPSVAQVVGRIRVVFPVSRRDIRTEDFSLTSLAAHGVASEAMLNVLLGLVLQELGVHSTVVGMAELPSPVLKLQLAGSKPQAQYLSWSHGLLARDEMANAVKYSGRERWWITPAVTQPESTRRIIFWLLKKQLILSVNGISSCAERRQSLCREQLLFLLS